MTKNRHHRPPKQTCIDILLKVAIVIEITIAIVKLALEMKAYLDG
jgi:hypothetical protein